MRHRIIKESLGFGNPNPELMNNELPKNSRKAKILKDCGKEAISIFFQKIGGCDFGLTDGSITIGYEPAYAFEPLNIIVIKKDKPCSFRQTGYAFGNWGSGIRSKTKYYLDYKYNAKFKKFVDKWHPRQKVCLSLVCRKQARTAALRKWRTQYPEYFKDRSDNIEKMREWRKAHPGYYVEYRRKHPELKEKTRHYVQRHRTKRLSPAVM